MAKHQCLNRMGGLCTSKKICVHPIRLPYNFSLIVCLPSRLNSTNWNGRHELFCIVTKKITFFSSIIWIRLLLYQSVPLQYQENHNVLRRETLLLMQDGLIAQADWLLLSTSLQHSFQVSLFKNTYHASSNRCFSMNHKLCCIWKTSILLMSGQSCYHWDQHCYLMHKA